MLWYPKVAATRDMAVFIVRESVMAVEEYVCTHWTPGKSAATLYIIIDGSENGKRR